MSWAERMKNIVSQSLQISAEVAGKAGAAAADFGSKATAKVQELGEKGALAIEIKTLEFQAEKRITKLGLEVYKCLVEEQASSVSTETPAVKAALDEVTEIRKKIEEKEASLKNTADSAG